MGELAKTEGGGLVNLFHNNEGGVIPLPFERDIFLFDTHVAGTAYVDGIEELTPYLKPEDRLSFFREPDNPHDKEAIVVKTDAGVKIGYIPRKDNVVVARLMDAGKMLFGKVISVELQGTWVKIDIGIWLHE